MPVLRWMGGYFAHLTLRESTAVGLGIAARGGMGIILATIALEAKFITPQIFTALVAMAIITSVSAGFIKKIMGGSQRDGWMDAGRSG